MPSITYNGVDLSAATYDLVVTTSDPSAQLVSESFQLLTKSYSPEGKFPPKSLVMGVSVTGTSRADIESKLDSIKAVLNQRMSKKLILSTLSDRYWMARFQGLSGSYPSPTMFRGTLSFTCFDPFAYAVTESDDTYDLDADPKVITVTSEGSADSEPILYLKAGEAWDASVSISNAGIGMVFEYSGAIADGHTLIINCQSWYVSLDGSTAMADISGQFPVLKPGANSISVVGFGVLGTLRIRYRARFI